MIVIPMAGMSSRFFKAGYKKPKYMLNAKGIPLFDHAVNSFKQYFLSEKFVFIIRDVYGTEKFVEERIKVLGIKSFDVVILNQETRGQAETVFLGLQKIDSNNENSLTIFNIDTFRTDFKYSELTKICDGYLEVFKGDGDNWSFVKPESLNSTKIIETSEKRPISDYCCTGLYYFSSQIDFEKAFIEYAKKAKSSWDMGELYIAPIYNQLISEGKEIHYSLIERNEVVFCGVPEEYIEFIESV